MSLEGKPDELIAGAEKQPDGSVDYSKALTMNGKTKEEDPSINHWSEEEGIIDRTVREWKETGHEDHAENLQRGFEERRDRVEKARQILAEAQKEFDDGFEDMDKYFRDNELR